MVQPASYAQLTDFNQVYPGAAFGDRVLPSQKEQALIDASALANSYLGDKLHLPLSPLPVPPAVAPYDRQLVRAVCQIAAWYCICLRGFNPDNPGDAVIRMQYDDALKWLTRVANGQATIAVAQADPPSAQPDISTNCQRGYGAPGACDPPWVNGTGGL